MMKKSPRKLSVIVPCYNEQSVIPSTYKRLKNVLNGLGYPSEVVFINDGSNDDTLHLLEKIASEDEIVSVISFSRNFGHQASVTAGIHNCTGDYAVIIDADLQDPPEIIPQMVQLALENNCNVVYGVRRMRKGETFFKKVTAKIFYRLLNFMSEVKMPVDTGDFRLIDLKVIETFKLFREKHKYIRGLISWIGFKQCPIYYDRDPRFAGETKYPIFKMLRFAAFGLLYFTKKPLKMATSLGFFSIFVAFFLLAYILISEIFYSEKIVSGWASLLTTVTFFGGVQLVTLGVLGEYIGSIFDEVKNRPEYIIENIIRKEK